MSFYKTFSFCLLILTTVLLTSFCESSFAADKFATNSKPGKSSASWRRRPPPLRLQPTPPSPPPVTILSVSPRITGIPIIPTSMWNRIRAIYRTGLQRGNPVGPVSRNFFSYIGDSNSAFNTKYPLGDPTNKQIALGNFGDLADVILQFRVPRRDYGNLDSFTSPGWAVWPGWRAADPLDRTYNTMAYALSPTLPLYFPFEPPYVADLQMKRWEVCGNGAFDSVECELFWSQSFVAIIMLGTNDLGVLTGSDPAGMLADAATAMDNLGWIIDECTTLGVIPVLSTIPPRIGNDINGNSMTPKVFVYNDKIRELAAAKNIPLWDFYNDIENLPGYGLGPDGTHLSVDPRGSGFLTNDALQNSANLRNLELLMVLQKLSAMAAGERGPDL